MSALPITDAEATAANDTIRQGLMAGLFGAIAMVARLLLSTDKATLPVILRSSLAAGLTAYFVNEGAKTYVEQENLRVFICGISGFASPEILTCALGWLKIKMQGKVTEARQDQKKKSLTKKRKHRG